jgi:hypothetical protein
LVENLDLLLVDRTANEYYGRGDDFMLLRFQVRSGEEEYMIDLTDFDRNQLDYHFNQIELVFSDRDFGCQSWNPSYPYLQSDGRAVASLLMALDAQPQDCLSLSRLEDPSPLTVWQVYSRLLKGLDKGVTISSVHERDSWSEMCCPAPEVGDPLSAKLSRILLMPTCGHGIGALDLFQCARNRHLSCRSCHGPLLFSRLDQSSYELDWGNLERTFVEWVKMNPDRGPRERGEIYLYDEPKRDPVPTVSENYLPRLRALWFRKCLA